MAQIPYFSQAVAKHFLQPIVLALTTNSKPMKKLLTFLLIAIAPPLFAQPKLDDSAYFIQDSVLVPTRSGVPLSAIIVRKKANTSPLPAILFYTTYHQGPNDAVFGKRSADRDYVGIVAYARGIRSDLKNYSPFEHETDDLYDLIDWVSKQSWCNGSVGMFGGSYTGYAQWAAMKKPHPALKTIVPQVAVMPGHDFPMENNVPLTHILAWSNDNIYKNKPLQRSLPFDYFNNGTAYNKMDSLAGSPNAIFQKWLQHPAYDRYWQSMAPTPQQYAKINIPILTTTGYYDGSQIGALEYFRQHYRHNKNANHYLVIGPYDHWGGQRKAAKNLMGYDIDAVADVSMMELAYDWLDYILKNKPKPALLKDKVNFEVMGANVWQHASTLEKTSNKALTFYLDRQNLVGSKPKQRSFQRQTIDFKDRENQNAYYTPEIVFDTLDTSNGLVFQTEAFEKEFIVNGAFSGKLQATISKKDIDVSLALYELRPDGKYFFLTRYIGRASYAKDSAKRQLLHPNQKAEIPFGHTRFVSKKIEIGSRLVILLNVNKHPFEPVNYGSGKEVSDETLRDAGDPLQIQWHNDSWIKIPVSDQ